MNVRDEQPGDEAAIHALVALAFGRDGEAQLIDDLRRDGDLTASLVAVRGGDVVGHVALSPVYLDPAAPVRLLGLAPLAVHPDHQRRGVGAALVAAAIDRARAAADALVVLGDPDYYTRFGFAPASRFGVRNPFGFDEHYMALPLRPGALDAAAGMVRYPPAFDALG